MRQVDDLLNDLTHFVTANANKKANYYLQPLMVKPRRDNSGNIIWDVLDGQQRLTTMLLLLKCLNEKLCSSSFALYTIDYANRPDIDFGNSKVKGVIDIEMTIPGQMRIWIVFS